ncbi:MULTISPECIES: hypothetical protein [Rhizobium]|uniref:hypothetical protein n=1 Tax=Rhizobium TaxID=379 RepID=UPI0013EECB37|nr:MULTISPECIES: hypothetical protein [Rhizobium]
MQLSPCEKSQTSLEVTRAELAAAILSAADMIRTLYIVVESGVEIDIKTGQDVPTE